MNSAYFPTKHTSGSFFACVQPRVCNESLAAKRLDSLSPQLSCKDTAHNVSVVDSSFIKKRTCYSFAMAPIKSIISYKLKIIQKSFTYHISVLIHST